MMGAWELTLSIVSQAVSMVLLMAAVATITFLVMHDDVVNPNQGRK